MFHMKSDRFCASGLFVVMLASQLAFAQNTGSTGQTPDKAERPNSAAPSQAGQGKLIVASLDMTKVLLTSAEGKMEFQALDKKWQAKVGSKQMSKTDQDAYQKEKSETAARVLTKLGPWIVRYAKENSLSVILEVSDVNWTTKDVNKPWPQGPVLWHDSAVNLQDPEIRYPRMDITQAVVDFCDAKLEATEKNGGSPRH